MKAGQEQEQWVAANQQYLVAALDAVRDHLYTHIGKAGGKTVPPPPPGPGLQGTGPAAGTVEGPFALDVLCERFRLSPFERDILLLCAGIELDSSFAELCASAQDAPERPYPTFSLALAALPGAHWSALSPGSPLRYWRMLEVRPGASLTTGQLRIDERILHYLTGVSYLDERLTGYATLCSNRLTPGDLVPSHADIVSRITGIWSAADTAWRWPVIQLCGPDATGKRDIAAAACAGFSFTLLSLLPHVLPTNPAELEALIRLCDRESILDREAIFLPCDDMDASDPARMKAVSGIMDSLRTPLIISAREPLPADPESVFSIFVHGPKADEQLAIWHDSADGAGKITDNEFGQLVSQFNLSARTIRHIGSLSGSDYIRDICGDDMPEDSTPFEELWAACREQTRARLSDLAQQIQPAADEDDLVLPDRQKEILHDIAAQVGQRMKVYQEWAFAGKNSRGLGISALFSGESGTGKTMAAEVLAKKLHLDLYRIDLSQVVSKYIGETEKNLRRVFDAAEAGGAILLFDEADALFGRRSEVKDSHDRYANIEVSYLLQRMEEYRGLAILTTNMKDSLDPAFLRRIRFVVQFPFPDAGQRALIWEKVFPGKAPWYGLDYKKLARLNIPGGNIRNIALSAAFLAAADGDVVQMKHLLRAARAEYAKMDRTLTDAETGGWV